MVLSRWAACAVLLALAGCELVVDPKVAASSTGGGGTTTGSGSTGASGSGSTGASGGGSGSGSGSGSTGSSCAVTGTTGTFAAGCSSTLPQPAPRADWPIAPVPDSTSTCGAACAPGTDAAWVFPPDEFCGYGQYAPSGGKLTNFDMSIPTRVVWQLDQVPALTGDRATALAACQNWNGGQHMALPTPWQSLQAMDFGQTSRVYPATWSQAFVTTEWAETLGGVDWIMDFGNGSFQLASVDGGSSAHPRCVDEALTPDTPTPPLVHCGPGDPPTGDDQCSVMFQGGPTYLFDESTASDTWAGALSRCELLPPCGSWRLPSYKELATLIDFDTPTGLGRNGERGTYWTSTALNGGAPAFMVIDFGAPDASTSGRPEYFLNASHQVICIRNP